MDDVAFYSLCGSFFSVMGRGHLWLLCGSKGDDGCQPRAGVGWQCFQGARRGIGHVVAHWHMQPRLVGCSEIIYIANHGNMQRLLICLW